MHMSRKGVSDLMGLTEQGAILPPCWEELPLERNATMASQDIDYAKHCEVYTQTTDLQSSHRHPMKHPSAWEEQEQRETDIVPDFSVSF